MVEWRVVRSFPWLEASSDGRVRRACDSIDGRRRAGREIVGSKNSNGYIALTIQYGNVRKINYGKHILICEAFHGPRPSEKHQVAHWNGNRADNRAENLRWVTHRENAQDRSRHGTESGENHGMARLVNVDIELIYHLKSAGIRGRDIGFMLDMNRHHINKIANGKTWTACATAGAANTLLSFGA